MNYRMKRIASCLLAGAIVIGGTELEHTERRQAAYQQ